MKFKFRTKKNKFIQCKNPKNLGELINVWKTTININGSKVELDICAEATNNDKTKEIDFNLVDIFIQLYPKYHNECLSIATKELKSLSSSFSFLDKNIQSSDFFFEGINYLSFETIDPKSALEFNSHSFEQYYTICEVDPYGLWIVKFKGDSIVDLKRELN